MQAAASASSSLISRVAVNKELRELNFNKLQTEAVPRIVPVLEFSASINAACHGPARWRPSSMDTWRKGSRHPALWAGQGPSFSLLQPGEDKYPGLGNLARFILGRQISLHHLAPVPENAEQPE